MDPLQDNTIYFHWQDAISDNGVASGRGGGRRGWKKSLVRKRCQSNRTLTDGEIYHVRRLEESI